MRKREENDKNSLGYISNTSFTIILSDTIVTKLITFLAWFSHLSYQKVKRKITFMELSS